MSSIYKFSGLDSYKLACLASNTIWFSHLKDFNDPFEGCVKINVLNDSVANINTALKNICGLMEKKGLIYHQQVKYEDEYSDEDKSELLKKITEIFESELEGIKKITACSFMDSGDDILFNHHMWSHYANGLRGYCLKFNKDKLTDSLSVNNESYLGAMNIKYNNNVPSIDPVEYFCSFDRRLDNSFITQSLAPKLKIYEVVSTKSESWANEKEIRLLSGKKGALKYDRESIEELIIGEKMPIDQQILLIKVMKSVNPDIEILKVVMKEDSYLLEAIEY